MKITTLHLRHALFLCAFFFGIIGMSRGQSAGFNNTFIVLSLNGGANTYYDLNAATANTDFNNASLGTFAAGSSNLILKGAEHNVWKCGSSDLTSTRLMYRIYLTASPSGSYTSQSIGYSSEFNNGCGGKDQVWSNTGLTTNLLSGLSAGAYTIEVYSEATVTNCCGGTVYASNSGTNYKATFTVVNNFYSKSTGNLELTSSWGSNTDGTGIAPPNFTNNGITYNIRNNATPTIGASWTVSGTGSKIVVGDGTNACNFTVPSTFAVTSPTTDVSNNGTITRTTSGANSWGTLSFASGATYVHNTSGGGTLPSANWDANSTLQIDASLNNNEFTENFGNVVINGTSTFFMRTEDFTSSIQGNFTHNGSASVAMTNSTSNGTLTIGGNLTISGTGTLRIQESADSQLTRNHVFVVNGNYIQTSGTLNLSNEVNASATSGCIANLQVKGNFTHTGGTISETAAAANLVTRISLTGTSGSQTLESTGQTGTVNFNVAGSNAQCVVAASKTFVLGSGGMTVANGSSAVDLLVDGTLRSASTITTSGAVNFSSTGTYEHNTGSGGPVPTASWNATSNCRIISSGSTLPSQMGQNFGNFEWANSTHGSTNVPMVAVMTSIQGNFTVSNTGTGTLRYNANTPASPTCSIGGNMVISGGTFVVSSGSSTPTFNVSGNFTQSGGTLTETGSGYGIISFVKSSGNQTFSQSAGTIDNTINWNVGNGTSTNTVQLGSNINLGTGTGTFTVLGNASFDAGANVLSGNAASTFNSGATIITAHASGINESIALSGTRTYSASTNYTFNGAAAQVTGAALTAANNITVNNSAGLTLSAGSTVGGTLTLTDGTLSIGNNTLTINGSVSRTSGTINASSGTMAFGNASNLSLPTSLFTGSIANLSKTADAGTLTLNDALTTVGNLTTTASTGAVILAASKQLTVTGTLTNNGTLTLENGATFKQGSSVTGSGTYNVKQTLTDGAGSGSTLTGRYWYMGTPVSCTRSVGFGTASDLNKVWSFTNGAYATVANETTLSPTTGYVHRRSDNPTLTFTGTNLYAQDVTLSLSNNAGTYGGWHLIANPYTAYLDWQQVYNASYTLSTAISPSYYIRSFNSSGNDVNALITYNSSTGLESNTSSYSLGSTGSTTAQYIAPMQAVWVKINPTSPLSSTAGQLRLERAFTSHQTGNVGLKNSTVFPTLVRVNLVDGARFDQMLVFMNQDMTNGVDQYDSEKMFVSGASQIYTMAAGKKLVMNGIKNNKKKISVPLYLELPESKVYNLQLAEYILEDGLILLEDKQEGIIQDFTINDVYAFYANSGVLSNRFVLHFFAPDNGVTAQGPSNSWLENETSYTEGGQIVIAADGKGKVQITLDQPQIDNNQATVHAIDANGRIVYNAMLEGLNYEFQLNVPSGVYYLMVQSGNLIEKKKVFIQE